MWDALKRLDAPEQFFRFAGRLAPGLGWGSLVLLGVGLYGALVLAPPDAQQGEGYRIIFIHVPSAWMSLFVYVVMAGAGAVGLVWNSGVAYALARASAPFGASFTFLALATGALWGKPMWGAWWVWDARLTSELILLFLYLGVIGLQAAIEDRRMGSRAAAMLAIVGVVNIPIIHFSVQWWNTLHQGPTVTKLSAPSIHWSMLVPLLVMAAAFTLHYLSVLLMRARAELLVQERHAGWVDTLGEADDA